ncbi:DUF6113 family protein [Streptomyces sp. NPDC050658]|uniref:DUF6113 family protein n=1 Tax=unclassified Streptomyces TaxID=2593676 RepID=UPI003443517F
MSSRSRASSASSASGKPKGSGPASASATATAGGSALAQPLNPGRIGAYILLFALGAVIGTAGALVQGGWFPGGLLLALLGAAGLFHGGSRAVGTRAGAVAPAAGWLVAVMLLTATRPEGDFLFGAGLGSYAFLLGGMAVAVMCATLGQRPQPGGPAARLGK